jgi:tetratricopeptide (TPR) repeat protein
MKHLGFLSIALALLLSLGAGAGLSQEGGGHTLYGDLKVAPRGDTGLRPQTFQVVLYTSAGIVVGRQAVPANGRYQFMNVRNGRYDLAVELEEREIYRVPLTIFMLKKTEIQRDLAFEWREAPRPREKSDSPTVPVGELYSRSPENADRWKKALEAGAAGDGAAAQKYLELIVAMDPRDFQAWTELGSAHYNRGDFGEAEKAYQRALKENDSCELALLNYAKLKIAQRNYDSAIEMLSRSIEIKPERAEAHLLLGEAYLQIKKGSKAVQPLNEALRLDPAGMAEAHLRLAALYDGAGLKEKAAVEYEMFLANRPDYPDREKLLQYIKANKKPPAPELGF